MTGPPGDKPRPKRGKRGGGSVGGPPDDLAAGEDGIRQALADAEDFVPGDWRTLSPPTALDRELAAELRNDLGNSRRLRGRAGERLLYCRDIGWHAWGGTHWSRPDGDSAVQRAAHDTAGAIFGEANALLADGCRPGEKQADFDKRVALHCAWAVASGNRNRLTAMVSEAEPYLLVQPGDMDADPLAFNVLNGTLRFGLDLPGLVRLDPHDPAQRIAKLAPVAFDPAATCPDWQAFLDRVVPDRPVQAFLQRWFGYCLTGITSEQVLVMLYGTGANGKSTLVEVIRGIVGDYGDALAFASLLHDEHKSGDRATPDIAKLPGVRLVAASEPENGARLSESTVKQLTGQDAITARHLNAGFFTFLPSHKLTLSFNRRPNVRGQDEGIWRRLRLVPFEQFIPPEERDRDLKPKLAAQAPGILNWMLDGLRLWLEQGLGMPDAVAAATAAYRSDSDPIGSFLDAVTRTVPGARVGAAELYGAYAAWCRGSAVTPFSQTAFGRAMVERGFRRVDGARRVYLDVELDHAAVPAGDQSPPPDGEGQGYE